MTDAAGRPEGRAATAGIHTPILPRRAGPGRELAQTALFFTLAAVLFTWPLVVHPTGRVAATTGPGDPYLSLWVLGWDLRALSQDPLALLTGRAFDVSTFHPGGGTVGYSDHLVPQALVLWPLSVATGNLALCGNVLLFLSLIASACAMYAFARGINGSRPGAVVAGLAWGFSPLRFAHLADLQLQSLYLLPLAFLYLHRVVAGRKRSDAVLLGVTSGLQVLASARWGFAGALGLCVAALALAIAVGCWRSLLLYRRLLLAGLVGVILVSPLLRPSWQQRGRGEYPRDRTEVAQYEAQVGSYLRVPPGNLFYGRSGLLRSSPGVATSRHGGPELELFPGFVLSILALFGGWRAWRGDRRPLAVAMAALAAVGLIVSLGPGLRGLYSLLSRGIPGFEATGAPARFGVLVTFAAAVLAAAGAADLVRSERFTKRGRSALSLGLVGLVGLEYFSAPIATVPAPPASRTICERPAPGIESALPHPGPPPDAGPVPFGTGERAVYRVTWLTGASIELPAARAVVTGSRIGSDSRGERDHAGFRIALELVTADWVAPFFEARDRFETWTDQALLPQKREQRLREGRREVDRVTRFDAFDGLMTVGDDAPVPMAPTARDGLAALLYARTLPLTHGYSVAFPIVEGGRELTGRLRVAGSAQVIEIGRAVDTWRLETRFEGRPEDRPITATVFISRDARRVPVKFEIDAGFGSFRAELVEYSSR